MKKLFLFLLIDLFLTLGLTAQHHTRLDFDPSGEFKIIQFTDTHVNTLKEENLGIFEYLKKIINTEDPDLVVVTGDIVTQDDPQEGYLMFVETFRETGVPWVMVFGNHDSEHNLSRRELAEFLEGQPGCLNRDLGETDGNSNFVLTVMGNDGKPSALLYFMDSNAYSTLQPQVEGWGWFTNNQVEWYRTQSKAYTKANGGNPYPALAFFHIPFPEYHLAMDDVEAIVFGEKRERVCAPEINTGMFAAMLESGDVMGTFVGHDHYNDYIVTYYGMALAYGRASKLRNQNDPDLGGRVIVLKEGKREFDTWIRDMHGVKEQLSRYPASFEGK